MVGGGPGAFIGAVHRSAAAIDGEMELVAGAFSSSADKSRRQGELLYLDPSRVYDDYQSMISGEMQLPADERIDFVSIVTPNNTHYPIARAFAEAGFHIVCDKPLTTNLQDALELRRVVKENSVVFALTHNYTGYPLVKHARQMVQDGKLGRITKVVAEYPQGWLATRLENEGQKQAAWRTDPELAGAGALGDIGSHAENLARYITGLHLEAVCADVGTVVDGRRIDDDVNLLVRYDGGARGIIYCSQISVGEENALSIRVYGTEGGLEWHQESPNSLIVRSKTEPMQILRAGQPYLCEAALGNTRLPPGHPEGFIEAFANVYRNAGRTILAVLSGDQPSEADLDFPDIDDGVYGMNFIDAALRSGESQSWVDARIEL